MHLSAAVPACRVGVICPQHPAVQGRLAGRCVVTVPATPRARSRSAVLVTARRQVDELEDQAENAFAKLFSLGGKKAKETEEAAGRAAKQAERKGTQVLKGAQRQAKEAPKRGTQGPPKRGTQVLKGASSPSGPEKKAGGRFGGRGRGRRDPKTVFVAGATGRLGARIVRELLNAGFKVRAGARDVAKAQNYVASAREFGLLAGDAARRLEVVLVDLTDESSIAAAIGSAGKVVQAIGAAEADIGSFLTAPKKVDGDAAIALVEAAAAAGVAQYVMVSSLGTGKFGWPAGALNLFGGVLTQKRRAEKALEASGMTYVIVRPGGMERPKDDYKESHNVRLASQDTLFGGQVSRLQVAELVTTAIASPDLAPNSVLEVVAEESAPALDYKTLLESFGAGNDAVSDTAQSVAEGIGAQEMSVKAGLAGPKTAPRGAKTIDRQPSAQSKPTAQAPSKARAASAAPAAPASRKPAADPAALARRVEERAAAAAAVQRKEADILGRLEAEAAQQRAKAAEAKLKAREKALADAKKAQAARIGSATKAAQEAAKLLKPAPKVEQRMGGAAEKAKQGLEKAAEKAKPVVVEATKTAEKAAPPAPDAKEAQELAKQNAAEAQKWIDGWRQGGAAKAQAAAGDVKDDVTAAAAETKDAVSERLEQATKIVKSEESGNGGGIFDGLRLPWQNNGTKAEAPAVSEAEEAVGAPGEQTIAERKAEARAWIKSWRVKTLENKLPQNVEAQN